MQLTIKEQLQQYVEQGDEKLLKMMLAVANDYSGDDEVEFTEADIKEFEERTRNRKNGTASVYSWESAKQIIAGK